MTSPKIGDFCHIQNYGGDMWIGKITEVYTKFESPLLYITGKDNRGIPQFTARRERELSMIGGEWWEKY